jgi:peptide/nickel transport system ATP-binding protein
MQHGKIVEIGPTGQIYDEPREQYTRALLSAVPSTDPRSRERRSPELDSVAEPALESA